MKAFSAQVTELLSRKLFENVHSLFANESDGYKTTSAPSAFRFSCGGALGPGKSRLPSKVNASMGQTLALGRM